MDELRKIKVRRALPGVVAGVVLCAVMLYLFYSMTPDQRMKRTVNNTVLSEHEFVQVGETTAGTTTDGEDARIDVYEAPRIPQADLERIQDALMSVAGYEHVEQMSLGNMTNPNYGTYVYTKASLEIAEIRLVPFYRNDDGDVRSRLIVRRHASFERNLWQLIFG